MVTWLFYNSRESWKKAVVNSDLFAIPRGFLLFVLIFS